MSLLIAGGTVVTGLQPPTVESADLLIGGGRVVAVGDVRQASGASGASGAEQAISETIDASGCLVMPGNVNAHTHLYSALARGMPYGLEPPTNFVEILQRVWWRLDRALDDDSVRASVLVGGMEALSSGTTTLIDHHASPNAIGGSLDLIANAVETAGVRAALCYEVTDRNGREGAQAGIQENVRFLSSLSARQSGLLAGAFGLHASLSLSEETLADCLTAARSLNTGFHVHVAEHEADEYDSLYKYGKRTVDRLALAGILGPKSIVAHAVHVDPVEKNLLHDTGTWVTHQPRSNMNNAVGVAEAEKLLDRGITVGLGNDGFYNNMFIYCFYL